MDAAPSQKPKEALINSVFLEGGAGFSVLLRQIDVFSANEAIFKPFPPLRTQLGRQVPIASGEQEPNLPSQTG